MKLLIRKNLLQGCNQLVDHSNAILNYVRFSLLRLSPGQTFSERLQGEELGIVVLSGKCSIRAGEERFEKIGEREDVFAGRAYALYVPNDREYHVRGETECEIALCYARCDEPIAAPKVSHLFTPGQNKLRIVGDGNWRREVVDIIDQSIPAQRLLIGETYNPPGNWSSYPPHRHENDNPPVESKHEELYYFRISHPQGFGFQRIYTDDGSIDETYTLKDGDVTLIPRGYHPVVAGAGYRLYYLWVLAGVGRTLIMRDDPEHQWIKGGAMSNESRKKRGTLESAQ